MSDVVIHIEGLGKRFRLGGQRPPPTFRESLVALAKRPFQRADRGAGGDTAFWALKDVSFDVRQGEVVAIIGRNGAGKSTLLKLLSRITEPTEGRGVIRGRVGSLLEVGTGFHGELTGRENIFLNGAILGMRRAEISRRFDEIVSYAEVEQFIDTPVKHYSSGMYMRLAFSVAAHLEPEILIVDEVLAVGDAAFQKKCLGKMSDVARAGRTVLFVSHNMAAIRALCNRGILLERGRVLYDGTVEATLRTYQERSAGGQSNVWQRQGAADARAMRIQRVGATLTGEQPRHRLRLDVELESLAPHPPAFIAANILDGLGASLMQALPLPNGFMKSEDRRHHVVLEIELPPLIPGEYGVSVWVGSHFTETLDHARSCVSFDITRTPMEGRTFPHGVEHGYVVPISRVDYTPGAGAEAAAAAGGSRGST